MPSAIGGSVPVGVGNNAGNTVSNTGSGTTHSTTTSVTGNTVTKIKQYFIKNNEIHISKQNLKKENNHSFCIDSIAYTKQ